MDFYYILLLTFILSALVGYKLIKNIPSLLHTPLMSGTNALSGITVLAALMTTGGAVYLGNKVLGCIAVFLAMLNVAGGFGVTHRMLQMFNHKVERS